jgi:hypothetical protein
VFRRNEIATAPFLSSLMEQMRGCDTAIVQVDANVLPRETEPRIKPDVLIEIGAAMALYGRNFVLLVEDQVALPLNVQGLCECRYRGDELNMAAMMELLRLHQTRRERHMAGTRPRDRTGPARRAAPARFICRRVVRDHCGRISSDWIGRRPTYVGHGANPS